MKLNNVFIPVIFLSLLLLSSCKKKSKEMNQDLFIETTATGLMIYQNKDTILSAAGSSPHGAFKLKFNSTVLSQLGTDGKLASGTIFNDGSLIVKEVYNGSALTLYAIMKKDTKSKFAANGWVWAEYDTNGKAVYSVSEKGKSCVSCHTSSKNRDLVMSFDLH
jgi:Cytochrome P460